MNFFRITLCGISFLLSTALSHAQFKCVLTITSPPSGISTFEDSVTVTGIVNTESGRPPLRDSCNVNGIAFTLVAGKFSVRVPLPEDGANTVRASCTFVDADGQRTACSQTIIVFRRERLHCELKIISPKRRGAIICDDRVQVCAAAAPSEGVPPFTRLCTVNGISGTFVGDTACAVIPLQIGFNRVKMLCEFIDSRQSRFLCEDSIIVEGCPPLACTVEFISPAAGLQICQGSITVKARFTISDSTLVAARSFQINGFPAQVNRDTLFATIPLAPGLNRIIAVCALTDTLGKARTGADTVTIFSDPTPPQCTLNFDQLPLITGEAFDNESGIAKIEVVESPNRTVTIASFQIGDPVVRFSSESINPNQISGLLLKITNRAGCVTFCDPIFLRLDPAVSPSFTFTIPSTDRFLLVNNRGLARIAMALNRREIELVASAGGNDVEGRTYIIPPDGSRTLDLAAFLDDGENTVTLTAEGPVGSSADVIFSDINTGTITGISEDPAIAAKLPHMFELLQSYPNPLSASNPSAAIRFHVPAGWTQPITLRVFNMQGQLVTTLVEGVVSPGVHMAKWDGKDGSGNGVASGVYWYQLTAGRLVVVRRMVLAK